MDLYGPAQLATGFRTARKNTIRIAEDIPEERYAYRPAEGSRSVAELLIHMALSTQVAHRLHGGSSPVMSFQDLDFSALFNNLSMRESDQRSKAEIVSLLKEEGDRFCDWLGRTPLSVLAELVEMPRGADPPAKNRFELLLGTKEHEMHHRGQLMVMERLLGIVPHLSQSRQLRRDAR